MIVTELFNEKYIRTYSDAGVMIQRDGRLFEDAIDPIGSGRTYTETDIPIPSGEDDGGDE